MGDDKTGGQVEVWSMGLEASGALDQCKIISAFMEILSQQKTLTEEAKEEEEKKEDPNIDTCMVNAKTSMFRFGMNSYGERLMPNTRQLKQHTTRCAGIRS